MTEIFSLYCDTNIWWCHRTIWAKYARNMVFGSGLNGGTSLNETDVWFGCQLMHFTRFNRGWRNLFASCARIWAYVSIFGDDVIIFSLKWQFSPAIQKKFRHPRLKRVKYIYWQPNHIVSSFKEVSPLSPEPKTIFLAYFAQNCPMTSSKICFTIQRKNFCHYLDTTVELISSEK